MAIKSRSRPINKIPFHFAKLSPLEQTSVKLVCRVSHVPVSAYKKWRRMEDCISIEAPGSPFLGTEEMFSRRRAWEAEAGAASPGLELMVETADTDSNKTEVVVSCRTLFLFACLFVPFLFGFFFRDETKLNGIY